jgi:hypothetical protein
MTHEELENEMSEATDLKAGTLLELLVSALPQAQIDYEQSGTEHRFLFAFAGQTHVIPLSERWFEAQTEQSLQQAANTIATRLQAAVDLYESA